jgi:hypothetical protein
LGLAGIDEEFGAGAETGIVRGKEERRVSDLVRIGNPAERHNRCELIEQTLLRRFHRRGA